MKQFMKYLFSFVIEIYLRFFISRNDKHNRVQKRIFYSGAFSGNYGGAKVKFSRLSKFYKNFWYKFDIVYVLSNLHFLTKNSISILKSKNIPIILNQNGIFYPGWFDGDWKMMNKKLSVPYHESDYVFWQSEFCKFSANKFLGERKGPGEILYNCVDTNFFSPKSVKADENHFIFLITGNIDHHLDYRVIPVIYALNTCVSKGFNFKLNLAGKINPQLLRKCFQIAKHLNLKNNFKYLGLYNQENAPNIYQNSHVYVMLKYKDPCPNTVIEALSCGLPILYSASGGVPEIVGNSCGVALKVLDNWHEKKIVPKDEQIVNGMIKIYKNYLSMSKNARNRAVAKFDIKYWIERHKIIFNKEF